MPLPWTNEDVVAVTVTYGCRHEMCAQVITGALADGASHVVVIANGVDKASESALRGLAAAEGSAVTVVFRDDNAGSATGFAEGMEQAARGSAPIMWLLDDDTAPQRGSLEATLAVLNELRETVGDDSLAVACARPSRSVQRDLLYGLPPADAFPGGSSFLNCALSDVLRRARRRRGRKEPRSQPGSTFVAGLPCAPYGGLMFHRAVIGRHGFPDRSFVTYEDDTEWTGRIVRASGVLALAWAVPLRELEPSWSQEQSGNPARRLLEAPSSARAYYSTRNRVYLERRSSRHRPAYLLNKAVFVGMLWVEALRLRRRERLALIFAAIRDGEAGHLGRRSFQ